MRPAIQTKSVETSRLRDYVALCKPRIAVMVLFTVFVGGLLSGARSDLIGLANAALGVLLIASSGCALNQYLERYTDFLMFRTSKRPLPGGRLSATEVAVFGAVTFGVGIAIMWMLCNWWVAVLGFVTWFLYVWIYTPLKLHTVYNTMIGAIPGAMPILIGAAQSETGISPSAWSFFAVLLIWQFPHFMSIAWLYREDYADGKIQMITVVDPSGKWAGRWAVGFGLVLIPVGCLPALFVESRLGAVILLISAIALGIWFLMASMQFARVITSRSWPSKSDQGSTPADVSISRKLLKVSLLYLPLYMLALLIAAVL